MRRSLLFSFALLLGGCCCGIAQDVVSASSGVLQYFEGAVILDNNTIEHKAAAFPSLKNGSVLRTEKGRAELLLTPGVYLRMDENSSLRMVSNSLSNTRLEVTSGAVILDTLNASSPGGAVSLLFDGSTVHFRKPGIYRIDSDLGELQVYSGEASVEHEKASYPVDSAHLFYFALQMTTNKFGDGAMDEFYDWARNRSDQIADQNERASAEQEEAQDPDPNGAAGLLGALPSVPPSLSTPSYSTPRYGSSSLYSSLASPFYVTAPPAPFLGMLPFPGIVVIAPPRHKPIGTKWPASTATAGFRPPPVITRWPTTSTAYIPGAGTVRLPIGSTYRPPIYGLNRSIVGTRPTVIGVPRVSSPGVGVRPVVPHVTPHVGAIGHR